MTSANPLTVSSLLRVLSKLQAATDNPELPLLQIQVLLTVAAQPDIPMADLEKVTNTSQASVSRTVAKLGRGLTPKEPGYGLLEAAEDPWHRKRKLVKLTPRGDALVKDLLR